jgi:hypothetical protein
MRVLIQVEDIMNIFFVNCDVITVGTEELFYKKSNKMQQCIKILFFHIYMKLNMFRATHRPSSGS